MANITDPSTGKGAIVDSGGRLFTNATTEVEIEHISKVDGAAYTANSHDATAAAGTYIFYFKNDSTTKNFHMDFLWMGGVASVLWKVWFVTGTAAGGNAITPTNMNKTSANTADATCRGDDSITGLSTVSQISTRRSVANSGILIDYDGALILGQGDAVAVEADAVSSTAIAEVFMRGYYLAPS